MFLVKALNHVKPHQLSSQNYDFKKISNIFVYCHVFFKVLSITSFYLTLFLALVFQCQTHVLKVLFLNFLFLENWIILACDAKYVRQ